MSSWGRGWGASGIRSDIEANPGYSLPRSDEGWSREETDQLFKLADEYDLRFVVMQDRWTGEKERTVDVSTPAFPSAAASP